MKENVAKTKMAVGLMLITSNSANSYGTEILMQYTANPGDHGLIRTDFLVDGKMIKKMLSQVKISQNQKRKCKNSLNTIKFRKNSKVNHRKNLILAPGWGLFNFKKKGNETVIYIVNKNNSTMELDLDRFKELGVDNKVFTEIHSKKYVWTKVLP